MNHLLRLRVLPLALLTLVLVGCSDDPTGREVSGLRVVVEGLPAGTAAAVTVSGPNSFRRSITSTEELADLPAGSYVVTAASVSAGGVVYGALMPSQKLSISGSTLATATVRYVNSASGLNITVSGAPSGTTPTVRVVGPNGFSEEVVGSALLPGLEPGEYRVSAGGVVAGDSTYQAAPVSQEVVVTGSDAAEVNLNYSAVGDRDLNLRIETAYLVQAAQTRGGTVPIVANRDAFVRVFAISNKGNSATPAVRVRFFHGPAEVATFHLPARSGSVVAAVDQATLNTSWNLRIPGVLLQPGLRMLAEVDPGNGVVEALEDDNSFPASGVPEEVAVHEVPALRLTVVPIHQSSNGRTGRVTSRNLEEFLSLTRKLHPIAELDVELREPYTTAAAPFDPQGDVWSIVVTELEAVRLVEAGGPVYYYGVVNPPYNGGVIGIANGIPSRTSLGWDRFPDASETMAHELGHNFGRRHTPCGIGDSADPDYPDRMGLIGVFGMDVAEAEIKEPSAFSDIMGYCETSPWVSDYTFRNVLQYRLANDSPPAASSAPSSLLVWGRIGAQGIVLEPAFRVPAPGDVPQAGGPYRVEGLDASGAQLFAYNFTPSEITHGVPGDRNFAFRLPVDARSGDRLASIRVSGEGRSATVSAESGSVGSDRGPVLPFARSEVRRVDSRTLEVQWDEARHRVLMIRDPQTGRVLSFARDGLARFTSSADQLEISYSNGVGSSSVTVPVQR